MPQQIQLLQRQQREGTITSGSHTDFFNAGTKDRVRVIADMDTPELQSDKSLMFWLEYFDCRKNRFRIAGKRQSWTGPSEESPSLEVRVPSLQETDVRVVIDTLDERINVGAVIEILEADE